MHTHINLVLHFLDSFYLEILPITSLDWCTRLNFSPSHLTQAQGTLIYIYKVELQQKNKNRRNGEKGAMRNEIMQMNCHPMTTQAVHSNT